MGKLAQNAEKQIISNLKLGLRGDPAGDKNMCQRRWRGQTTIKSIAESVSLIRARGYFFN
ncbi:MAG: hypothetical protein IPN53_01830 [Comamonadaceae bacterium]|nr:hypothetical protein [Comamonadaceae bacterium]